MDTAAEINHRYETIERAYIDTAGNFWSWLRDDPVFSLAAWLDQDWPGLVGQADEGNCCAQTCVLIWAEKVKQEFNGLRES